MKQRVKSVLSWLVWFSRIFICKHHFVFYRLLYGDEALHMGYRKEYRCTKCGKIRGGDGF